MQLIKQGFEFVVGDFIAHRLCHHRCRLWRHAGGRVGAKLPLAVQLVEQRLEFGIADFITACRRCNCLHGLGSSSLDCIQGVQQQFKFVIGDIAAVAGHRFGDRHRSGDCRHRSWLGQTCQRRQQLRGCRRNRAALAHLGKHGVDRVQGLKNHVHQFRVDATLTLAQDVENVLGDVAALHQLVELEEAGAPFYSVKTAKNCIEQVRIIRSAFKLDQLFGQQL